MQQQTRGLNADHEVTTEDGHIGQRKDVGYRILEHPTAKKEKRIIPDPDSTIYCIIRILICHYVCALSLD